MQDSWPIWLIRATTPSSPVSSVTWLKQTAIHLLEVLIVKE